MSKKILLAMAATLLVVACGGGGDALPVAASDAVPAAASQSSQGMVNWITALTKEDAEAKEPLAAAAFAPPAPDDTEPVALQ